MSTASFPESLSQAISAGIILVGRLGVIAGERSHAHARPCTTRELTTLVSARTSNAGMVQYAKLYYTILYYTIIYDTL